jgi:CheY-like chemotaxis protein
MTTETMQPPVELEAGPAAGQGESKGHRRRRRRRKNKSSAGAPVQQSQPQQAQAAPPPPPHSKPASQPQARKKKKFFQKTQQPQAQPGNSIAPPSQARRKTRQKGPREFVGPMDHSYRVANGNVADSPPATIQVNGNGGSYYQEVSLPSAPVPIREDAPTRIYCFIEDLFFLAKINETARKLGVKVEFVKGADKELVARLTEAPEEERPALMVFDLNNANAKPLTLIPKLKAKLKKSTSIIGFLSHVQGDLKMKASEAGCDTVMPRSAFSQSLPNLLRRYGLEEEEEYVPQPV